jgi:hypothetical protein
MLIMVQITKADGSRTVFKKSKIVGTCLRSGLSKEIAVKIADEVNRGVYEGMRTREILKKTLSLIDKYESKQHKYKYNLKQSIAELDPEHHQFERFITHLFRELGYKTRWNVIVQGEVIEHQIDSLLEKGGRKLLIECKHHINPHRLTGLGTVLTTWAVLDDVRKGPNPYNNIWLVNNTKFSNHAKKYSAAKKMKLIGWNFPKGLSLPELIEKTQAYPANIISMSAKERKIIMANNILLAKELASCKPDSLSKKTGLRKSRAEELVEKAKTLLKA